MMLDDIRAAHTRRPFQPFTLHIADSRSVRVSHPELLLIPPGKTRTLVLATSTGKISLIDALMITELEIEESRPKRRAG